MFLLNKPLYIHPLKAPIKIYTCNHACISEKITETYSYVYTWFDHTYIQNYSYTYPHIPHTQFHKYALDWRRNEVRTQRA